MSPISSTASTRRSSYLGHGQLMVALPLAFRDGIAVSMPLDPHQAAGVLGTQNLGHPVERAADFRLQFRPPGSEQLRADRKSTRLNSSYLGRSYAYFCLN